MEKPGGLNKVLRGDCLEVLKTLEENSIDSIVTDPPYELGFMGKSWDNTGIANNPKMWAECLRVLKPGGHLLAFSGTRTYHRMASAIEDAGFEVRDMIEWVYGSGFPKSLNIGKAVDKLQGNEREVVGEENKAKPTFHSQNVGGEITEIDNIQITKGTSEWEGWGTALKPAHEPICMARKPVAEKTVAENVLKYGTGGIDIDGSRVGTEELTYQKVSSMGKTGEFSGQGLTRENGGLVVTGTQTVTGRFPANLIHDGSDEVKECFPETKTGKAIRSNSGGKTFGGENIKPIMEDLGYEDGGGNASRFFKSIVYQAKASKSERNKGCEGLEEKKSELNSGGIGRECSVEKRLGEDGINAPLMKNNHPTVKPIALMTYLIKMVTPKGGAVLDPFAGSGSTLVAAKENGYQYVGIEMTSEYIPIIEARLKGTDVL